MIDSRIKSIIGFVREGSRVADIGTDHGYLAIELIKSGRATKVIATEKNIGPFEAAHKNISLAQLNNAIDIRLGDGLKVLSEGEVDTICIAGMGGALITNILSEAPEIVKSARQVIVQPMNASKKIRDWFTENDLTIVDEDLAESAGIIYEIINSEKNSPKKIFKRDTSPLLRKFLMQRLEKLQSILAEMNKSQSARFSKKFLETLAEIDCLSKKLNRDIQL